MFILKKFQKQNADSATWAALNSSQNGVSLANRGVQPMHQQLQRKFARGIQYNMKIIIRGDRNVGKTCLFHRLQGDKFHEEYVASEEIKVASIQWNYNATDDVVKVEIWDVVDKGKKRENFAATVSNTKDVLKMHNNQTLSDETVADERDQSPALDAEFVDVYKGTNGVIFLFDMTKAWTFDYIIREIHRCPLHIPILILGNHRDMGHHRVITADQVQGFIDSLLQEDVECNRNRTGQIRYSESSMRNGFGLRFLYKFFNLPYLHLQRETLIRQLERNMSDITATVQELDIMAESDEQNYDNFLEMLTNKRRMLADQLSATNKSNLGPTRSVSMPASMAAVGSNDSAASTKSTDMPPPIAKPMPSIIIGANNPLPPKYQQQFEKKPNLRNHSPIVEGISSASHPQSTGGSRIEDFIPDDVEQNMFRKFLDEPNLPQIELPAVNEEDSDDEESTHNMVVAKYQEDLDPEDMIDTDVVETEIVPTKKEEIENDIEPSNLFVEPEMSEKPTLVLNTDEIDALENLYVSKHSNRSDGEKLWNEDTKQETTKSDMEHLIKAKKSNQSGSTKKKSKKSSVKNSEKSSKNETFESDGSATKEGPTKKSTARLKTKNGNKQSPISSSSPRTVNTEEDEERKRLEEFLGASDFNSEDKSIIVNDRDPTSYQMF